MNPFLFAAALVTGLFASEAAAQSSKRFEGRVVQQGSGWVATYYDSPRSLRPKLELARSQGLAGAGFWALGYDRGLPGYVELMNAFRTGRVGG